MQSGSRLLIGFAWSRVSKGFRIEPAKASRLTTIIRPDTPERLVPLGDKAGSYRPLEQFETLYAIFAKVSKARELIDFANKFGPLTKDGYGRGDNVGMILEDAGTMRRVLTALSKDSDHARTLRKAGVARLSLGNPVDVAVVPDQDTGRIKLSFQPRSLLDGLWLQMASAIGSGAVVRSCRLCGEWFEAGPGTDRRADAQFCSAGHKADYFSLQRSRADASQKSKPHQRRARSRSARARRSRSTSG
jgi:hypothetical protein